MLIRTLVFAFGRLSIDRATALGAVIGRLWFGLSAPRTRQVRQQLAMSFPEIDPPLRERWARDVFVHLGRGLAELILAQGRHRDALLDRVRIEGIENLEAARQRTRAGGVLVVTGHLGNWELGCAEVARRGLPVSVVYRDRAGSTLDTALLTVRGARTSRRWDGTGAEGIPMDGRAGIRVSRALEEGRLVVVLLDQNARRHEGVFVSFFGRLACTRSGPLVLASLRGVPVVPAFMRRDPDGRGHRLRIDPALQLEPGASDDEEVLRRNLQQVTGAIEKEIRACPGQWIWTHRRWRTRPGDEEHGAADDRSGGSHAE